MTHNVNKELDKLNDDFWGSDLAPIFENEENHIYINYDYLFILSIEKRSQGCCSRR